MARLPPRDSSSGSGKSGNKPGNPLSKQIKRDKASRPQNRKGGHIKSN